MPEPAVQLLSPVDATPSNPRWHALRRNGISASEIAAVMGLSPWESPFSLYWRKKLDLPVESNADMRAGVYAESAVAAWFADQHEEFTLVRAGLYAHPRRPWQLATPDRLLYRVCPWCDGTGAEVLPLGGLALCPECEGTRRDGFLAGLLECKYCPGGWDGWGEPGTDDIPVYYRAQDLWQADVMGVDRVFNGAWHGSEFRSYMVRHDERDLRVMRAAGERMMDRLANDDPPPLDGHAATIRTLKVLHPTVNDIDIEVDPVFAEGYRRARALRTRADNLVDRYEALARGILGDGRRLMCGGRLVVSRSVYDQSGDMAELDSLDADLSTVDRLNPGRAATYLTPKGTK